MKTFWTRFWKETEGQDLVEYALIVAAIALGMILVVQRLGLAAASGPLLIHTRRPAMVVVGVALRCCVWRFAPYIRTAGSSTDHRACNCPDGVRRCTPGAFAGRQFILHGSRDCPPAGRHQRALVSASPYFFVDSGVTVSLGRRTRAAARGAGVIWTAFRRPSLGQPARQ